MLYWRFGWKQLFLFYERNGYEEAVGGQQTCFLLMNSLVEIIKKTDIRYSSFQSDPVKDNVTESLAREVGIDNASKFNIFKLIIN